MQIRMQNSEALTREQIDDFLKGTEGVSFVGEKKKEVYAWGEGVGVPGVSATGQEAAGSGPGIRGENDRVEQRAGNPADPAVPENGGRGGESLSAAVVYADLHRRGPGDVGGGRPGARMVEWAGHAAYFGAGIYMLRQAGVCTPGQDFQRPSVQPASECRVPQAGGRVQAHAGDGGEHRGTEAPGAGGTGGVSASGHGASGRLGRRQGGLPYQCRGRGNAMAGGGVREPDQRGLS